MAQRSLLVRLTPPNKKSRLEKCEKSGITPALNAKDAVAAQPFRRVSRRILAQSNQSNDQSVDKFFTQCKPKHGKQQRLIVSFNKVRMQRDRVIQEIHNASNSKRLMAMLKRANVQMNSFKKKVGRAESIKAKHVCIKSPLCGILHTHISMHTQQVYEILENNFVHCPWPIPPSSVLMYLALDEIPGNQTREARLRSIISNDMKWRHTSQWEFRPVRPYPAATLVTVYVCVCVPVYVCIYVCA